MAQAPEATTDKVQAPENPKTAALAAAREEHPDVVLPGETAPEADPVDGTGEEASPAAEKQTEEAPPEVDWSDEASRDAELTRREEQAELKTQERLSNQLSSLQGELSMAEQGRAEETRNALLKELDALAESDPEKLIQRLRDEPESAQAMAQRSAQVSPVIMQQARQMVAVGQAKQLFGVRPDLEEAASIPGSETWREAITGDGGIFGYVDRTAREEGGTEAVEKFKNSKEYTDAIAGAERRAAHDVIGDTSGPPPSEDGKPASADPTVTYDDPAQQAVAEAARELGKSVDVSKIQRRRRTPASAA